MFADGNEDELQWALEGVHLHLLLTVGLSTAQDTSSLFDAKHALTTLKSLPDDVNSALLWANCMYLSQKTLIN